MQLVFVDLNKEVYLHDNNSTVWRVCRIGGCLTTPYAGLEPYGVKVPSTVLRGKGGSDPAGLPGTAGAVAVDSFAVNFFADFVRQFD